MSSVYVIMEISVAVVAIIGNFLVILAFKRERQLRKRTNYYIISLAMVDLLVACIAIPSVLLNNNNKCMETISVLVVFCTISILSLVAVSIDRYWAILYPISYATIMTSKRAIGIICVCWLFGILMGLLPLFGFACAFGWNEDDVLLINNNNNNNVKCLFPKVMHHGYLHFIYFATIIFPAFLMAFFYAHIHTVVLTQVGEMMKLKGTRNINCKRLSVISRQAHKREVKVTQSLSIIVIFFVICWFPLYTVNCVETFVSTYYVSQTITNICITLSHLNSALNPFLYAYHLQDFRCALKALVSSSRDVINHDNNVISINSNTSTSKMPSSTPRSSSTNAQQSRSSIKLFVFDEENESHCCSMDHHNFYYSSYMEENSDYAYVSASEISDYYTRQRLRQQQPNKRQLQCQISKDASYVELTNKSNNDDIQLNNISVIT